MVAKIQGQEFTKGQHQVAYEGTRKPQEQEVKEVGLHIPQGPLHRNQGHGEVKRRGAFMSSRSTPPSNDGTQVGPYVDQ